MFARTLKRELGATTERIGTTEKASLGGGVQLRTWSGLEKTSTQDGDGGGGGRGGGAGAHKGGTRG